MNMAIVYDEHGKYDYSDGGGSHSTIQDGFRKTSLIRTRVVVTVKGRRKVNEWKEYW